MKFKLEDLRTTRQSLISGDITLEDIHEKIEERRIERVINVSKKLPTLAAEFPEVKKLIILIDIVGFSKASTREQVNNIYLFQRYLVGNILNNHLGFKGKIHISRFIPTGDGCYIVADECEPETALDFLTTLIGGFNQLKDEEDKPLSIRASALIGSCVPFMDIAKHKNYIGEGMNEAARILSGGQSSLEKKFAKENPEVSVLDAKMYSRNSLYLGDSLTKPIKEYKDICNSVVRFLDVPDKHGMKRNITILQGIKFE